MPESRIRRKALFTPPKSKAPVRVGSPRWLAPLMIALFLIGLLWLVVYYVTSGAWPIGALNAYNLLVGFAFIVAGFLVSTQWK